MNFASVTLTNELAWPWRLAPLGPWGLVLVAVVLAGLTIWTYVGVARANTRRVSLILGLRLAALVMACLMIIRPSIADRKTAHAPGKLLVVIDATESMANGDEYNDQTRWEVQQRLLRECEPLFQALQEEQQLTIEFYQFADKVAKLDPQAKPDGRRTDFSQMLHTLHEDQGSDRSVRMMLILSDGADNGSGEKYADDSPRLAPLTEAKLWAGLPCPIQTFGFGKETSADRRRDIAFNTEGSQRGLTVEPFPVRVKGQMKIRASIDAPGFENTKATVRLLIDDKEAHVGEVPLPKTSGNEVEVTADAPSKASEIKVTLKVDPQAGEATVANNEISTYVTVTQEGLSVLYVDKLRSWEPQFICDALSVDPRIRLYVDWRRGDETARERAELLDFDKQRYDVIILGDLTAQRLAAGNRNALEQIKDLVKNKGTGLLMMGGFDSFGNSDWANTPIADLLPVHLDEAGQIEKPIKMEPTEAGLAHYVLRLADKKEDNRALWGKLPELKEMTRLGRPKPNATVLAVQAGSETPVLVYQQFGKGRTLAFAGDTTWRWRRQHRDLTLTQGVEAHARFWRQLVLFLAQQDETDGSVWLKLETRRLAAGNKLRFDVGARGKGGVDLPDARVEVRVIAPNKIESPPLELNRDKDGIHGNYWKTDAPGEYVLAARGWTKDDKGEEVSVGPETKVRFLVYEDDVERSHPGADHVFLNRLAQAGGGKFYRAQELPQFLKELRKQPGPQSVQETRSWPDWSPEKKVLPGQRSPLSGFLAVFFLLFVALLCLEWYLRRSWGLV